MRNGTRFDEDVGVYMADAGFNADFPYFKSLPAPAPTGPATTMPEDRKEAQRQREEAAKRAEEARTAPGEQAARSRFLEFLGISANWRDIGVGGLLAALFLVGVVTLLTGSRSTVTKAALRKVGL